MSVRTYKSGSTWCFWRWTFVDTGYITRLHLVKTPWFAVCLHWLNHPDPEPYPHDHPVSFLSLILRGEYTERRGEEGNSWRTFRLGDRRRRWWNFVRATDVHSIIMVKRGTLTLALMGPKVREWGFHTPSGWQSRRDYYAEKNAAEAARSAR